MQVPDSCMQVLLVLGDSLTSKFGDAFLLERKKESWKVQVYDRIELGKSGWTYQKEEGDLKSVIGQFNPLYFFGKQEYQQRSLFPFLISSQQLIAVDDPKSKYYNRILDQDTVEEKDWDSAEQLMRDDHLYDIALVSDVNYLNPIPGKGSCLFHHIKRGVNGGTEGCIAYSYQNFIQVLSKLQPKLAPIILQGPREELGEDIQIQF